MGDRYIFTPNEPNELRINYYLDEKITGILVIDIFNQKGKKITVLKPLATQGMHHVQWNTWRTKQGIYKD